ncbi:ROK family protein [Reichenbachiella versicolor]|uniref:ROK family protein n=1 Tax=Reichenbachiella versicolor TaxID=1821036 RepID=UPI000D6EA781|nr:ROK family protein [Reichenbachiella versicolor]
MLQIIAGVDIGGTSTKYGLVDNEGNVLYQGSVKTQFPDVNDYIDELENAIREGLESLTDTYELVGVGIGAPNGNYFKGTIEEAPNLPWSGVVPIGKLIEDRFGVPVALTNDANAAAIGEMVYGGAKGMKNFIVITLGTGLGSGLVSNGEMILGHQGFAGELGHQSIKTKGGRQCKCGQKGCLETYVSATGIKRTVYKLLADHHIDSELRNYSFVDLNAKIVADHAKQGDALAIEAFEYTGSILGAKLADAVVYTDPEAIFIMGGLAQAGELLFKPTIKALNDNSMAIFKDKVKVLPSKLDNQTAPIVGAASLIIQKMK